ncbi:hypothetical protein [Streptomyces sp. MAR4 CNX-425]|uniref:hypothetical protein n=1 Tax=Streptomyces sp. MAR4 CNX-425 TaxID=3406343 RepID=UPI003B509E51
MPLHGADGNQRVRIPRPTAPRPAGRRAAGQWEAARPEPGRPETGQWETGQWEAAGSGAAGAWRPAAGQTRHLRLRLCEPARRSEARRLLALVLDAPPLPGADPAVLIAEVPDGRRAVDVLIELAWSGIDLDAFGFDAAA